MVSTQRTDRVQRITLKIYVNIYVNIYTALNKYIYATNINNKGA